MKRFAEEFGVDVDIEAATSFIERNIVDNFAIGIVPQGTATISCNDVWNCPTRYQGVADPTGTGGNISVDPLFCVSDDDYGIEETSPCAPGNHPDGAVCDGIGAGSVGCVVDVFETPTIADVRLLVPNPALGRARISREGSTDAAEVRIYDVAGRLQFVGSMAEGVKTVEWDGRRQSDRAVASSGVYFVELRGTRTLIRTRFVWIP